MTPWSAFLPLVLIEAPGCPDPTAEQYLRLAAREFCSQTYAWREWLADIPVAAGTALYPLTIPAGLEAQLLRITTAALNDEPLAVLSQSDLPAGWQAGRAPRKPCVIVLPDGQVQLGPVPTAAGVLRLQVALQPTPTAEACGDVLLQDYQQAIADGALGRLLALANVPFAQPARAIDCRTSFEREVHRAANADFLRKQPAERRVRTSRF